jgi:alkylhydroperoxidase/carboxymuconolactone decarboxylase family protein YurZ
VVGHTAAGKLLGRTDDAVWYELAYLVGAVHGMNGVADGLRVPLDFGQDPTRVPLVPLLEAGGAEADVQELFREIAAFFGMAGPPNLYRALAHDPGYAADQWRYVRYILDDGRLSRRDKALVALATSMAARSPYGTDFHARWARHLGADDATLLELAFVTEQFHAVNKIGSCLQLEPDMQVGLRPPGRAGGPAR